MQIFINIYLLIELKRIKIGLAMDSQLQNSDVNSLEESKYLAIKKLVPISNENDNIRRCSKISKGWFLTEIIGI